MSQNCEDIHPRSYAEPISIHAPHARSDVRRGASSPTLIISIHAPHARSDIQKEGLDAALQEDFNPRSSCEERLPHGARIVLHLAISIHAPHARSDSTACGSTGTIPHFNPRSSCEERHATTAFVMSSLLFQSTLLMRGATCRRQLLRDDQDFNPRSSCEERLVFLSTGRCDVVISIHAPHARSDTTQQIREYNTGTFQSTLLMRGATSVSTTPWPRLNHFNPRSSCEERHYFDDVPVIEYLFQSTLLMRGATVCNVYVICTHHFNPRSSCEERQAG